MYALNFFQNDRQVSQDVGLDKFIWLDMLMVRERLQVACAWIGGIVIAEYDSTAPAMMVSIKIFFNRGAFTLDKLFEIKNSPIPEFYSAREKGDITSFSIDGERVRRNERMR
jgi:hypothetical protein